MVRCPNKVCVGVVIGGENCAAWWHVDPRHRSWSVLYCAKSLQGEAPCGSAVYGKVDEMSPAPPPPLPSPNPSPCLPLPLPDPPSFHWTPPPAEKTRRTRTIDNITGKGLRTAVALSTASCCRSEGAMHLDPLPHILRGSGFSWPIWGWVEVLLQMDCEVPWSHIAMDVQA